MPRTLVLGLTVACMGLSTAAFADPLYRLEVGARYWYSEGKEQYKLGDQVGSGTMVSQLTFTSMIGNSGEFFADLKSGKGWFAKAYLGAGSLSGGNLQDEDFPPYVAPYSSTDSPTKGNLKYGSIDLGYNVIETQGFSVGPFIGYHYWKDSNEAYGCS